eukprot:COSAG03_NODE_311_length_9123_cov_2.643506_3_plen_71_part_00
MAPTSLRCEACSVGSTSASAMGRQLQHPPNEYTRRSSQHGRRLGVLQQTRHLHSLLLQVATMTPIAPHGL